MDTFRQVLLGDPPARVEPVRIGYLWVQLKPQARVVKGKLRRYDPVKTGWLAACIAALMTFGLLVRNVQAVWANPAMAVPKRDIFRLDSDSQAINTLVEQSPGVMPIQEDKRKLLGEHCFGEMDLLQRYWQMSLTPEAREIFTEKATPEGLFTPTRVPQGVSNATEYFQCALTDFLRGLNCKVWVHEFFLLRKHCYLRLAEFSVVWRVLVCSSLHTNVSFLKGKWYRVWESVFSRCSII